MAAPNAFQNQNPGIHRWITIEPSLEARQLRRSSFCQNLISKISLVAIAIISLSVLVASFLAGGAAGSLPFILVGLILITPFLAMAASKYRLRSKEFSDSAELQEQIAVKLETIKGWSEDQIRGFFNQHNKIPSDQVPIQSYLPLIARFLVRREACELQNQEVGRDLLAENIQDREIRLRTRQLAWEKLEHSVIPKALEAALILEIAINPFSQMSLADCGTFVIKSFDERHFDLLHGPNDNYLLRNNPQLPPLTLRELQDDLTPSVLHGKLFPPVPAQA